MPRPDARKSLTDASVRALKPVPGKRVHVFDKLVPGLAIRVSQTGAKSFVVVVRHAGRQRWVTIGKLGVVDLADARQKARDAVMATKRGVDPAPPKPKAPKRSNAFEAVVADFIQKYARVRNKSWPETERLFRTLVTPVWKGRDIGEISRADVLDLIDNIAAKNGPYAANRVLAAVRKLFNWAASRDLIASVPTERVAAPGAEQSRDRVLTDAELAEVWAAAGTLAQPFGQYAKMLILTAQRRSEVAGLRWADVALDDAAPLWALDRTQTKAARAHDVPLVPAAVELLRTLPRYEDAENSAVGVYAFTTTRGRKPVSCFADVKSALDKAIMEARKKAAADPDRAKPMPGWRVHDLRRTAASGMARLGVPVHILSAILNHSPGATQGITSVYNRFKYGDEKRRALEAWARHVGSIVDPAAASNVVALREAATA